MALPDTEEPMLDILERDLLDSRRRLARLVDRCEALAALWGRSVALQADLDRPVTLEDLKYEAARHGEHERALLESQFTRILGEEAEP